MTAKAKEEKTQGSGQKGFVIACFQHAFQKLQLRKQPTDWITLFPA